MTDLEKLRQWLMTYPGWEGPLHIQSAGPAPGSSGLYPQGMEELSRREDVLGNVTVSCRSRYLLYRVAGPEEADWLEDFQHWVCRQSAEKTAPTFGDVPEGERLWAQKGRLEDASQPGLGRYAVELVAEFIKQY